MVAELRAWWNETKKRASPRCSPNNSDDEDEEDIDDEEGGEMGTTELVFGNGNGWLGVEAHDEVICRNEARKDKKAAVVSRKKTKLQWLISSAKVIKDKMKSKTYKAQWQRTACIGEVQACEVRSENTQHGGRTPRLVEWDKKMRLSSL